MENKHIYNLFNITDTVLIIEVLIIVEFQKQEINQGQSKKLGK